MEAGEPVRSFIGCAYAVKIERVLAVGGYRDFFFHMGEERDLCLRLMDAGGFIALADTDPIVHTVHTSRDMRRNARFAIRNTLLFSVLNAPLLYVAPCPSRE